MPARPAPAPGDAASPAARRPARTPADGAAAERQAAAHPVLATTRVLQGGLDVLVVGLVLLAVGQVLVAGGGRGGPVVVVLLAAAVLAVYALGRLRVRVADRPISA
ncbi:hypothetical protein ACFU5J_18500, partial [Isoptericola sp. NPDC057559]